MLIRPFVHKKGVLTNSKDPDEPPQNAAFYHFLRSIRSSGAEVHLIPVTL